jgi:hypothetical protein
LIATELVRCDSLREELVIIHELLGLTEAKVYVQDSINTTLKEQHILYNQQIATYQQQNTIHTSRILELQSINTTLYEKNERLQTKFLGMTGVSLLLVVVIVGIM